MSSRSSFFHVALWLHSPRRHRYNRMTMCIRSCSRSIATLLVSPSEAPFRRLHLQDPRVCLHTLRPAVLVVQLPEPLVRIGSAPTVRTPIRSLPLRINVVTRRTREHNFPLPFLFGFLTTFFLTPTWLSPPCSLSRARAGASSSRALSPS